MRVNGNLTLNDNGSGEIRHVYIERLDNAAETAAAQVLQAAHTGRLIFNTTSGVYKYWNGTEFIALAIGSVANGVQAELDALEAALGALIKADGTFNATAISAMQAVDITNITNVTELLMAIDAAIAGVDVTAQIQPIKDEVDAIEAAVGLAADGTFVPFTGTNYIDAATSVVNAEVLLDSAVKAVADANAATQAEVDALETSTGTQFTDLQAELDATQVGAGLGEDGAYTAKADANYIQTATSLKSADELLDAAVKANADLVATKQNNLGYVPVNKAGDSVDGNLMFAGVSTVKNLAAPVDAGDAVRLADLEAAMLGLDIQADIQGTEGDFAAQETKIAGRYVYADGVTFTNPEALDVAAGDIVRVDAAGVITAVEYDVSVAGPGALTWNRTDSVWNQYVGDPVWTEFGGLSGITAGVGLSKSGNTINVRLGAGIGDLPTGEVGVELLANGGLRLVDAVSGEEGTGTDAVLAAKVAGSLEITAAGIDVKDAGISEVELAASVAGNGLQGGAGTALSVKAADSSIIVDASGVKVDVAALDAKYVDVTGDTMTGALVLAGDAVQALEAVTKQQMDVADQAVADAVTAAEGKIDQVVASLNKTYYAHTYTNTGATAAITVAHNLGVKYCNVTVVDDLDEVFIPQAIKFIDANTLEVTLNSDISGTVVVMGHATLTLA